MLHSAAVEVIRCICVNIELKQYFHDELPNCTAGLHYYHSYLPVCCHTTYHSN